MQVAGAVLILLLVSMILFTGRGPIPQAMKKSPVFIDQESDFGDIELPPPVRSEESISEVRDSKIRRSRGRKNTPDSPEAAIPGPIGIQAPPECLDGLWVPLACVHGGPAVHQCGQGVVPDPRV